MGNHRQFAVTILGVVLLVGVAYAADLVVPRSRSWIRPPVVHPATFVLHTPVRPHQFVGRARATGRFIYRWRIVRAK